MDRRLFLSTLAASPLVGVAQAATIGGDGLHKQDWFLDSFLEMPDDLAEAADSGKCAFWSILPPILTTLYH